MKNCLTINNTTNFNIKNTLLCGQVFRYEVVDFGYKVYAGEHKVEIYCQKGTTTFFCDNEKFLIKYLDFNTNYDMIEMELGKNINMIDAINFGKGIHILRQEPLETLISFIISANNNIPRIKKIINSICENYGTNCGDYYAFPTLLQLSKISESEFKKMGAGYRDKYLVKTIKMLCDGFDLNKVFSMNTTDARKYLMKLSGVGRKVADCVLLFGFYKTDVFPTDTWITKAYNNFFKDSIGSLSAEKISEKFSELFKNLSGYAQQYLFYYTMTKKQIIN